MSEKSLKDKKTTKTKEKVVVSQSRSPPKENDRTPRVHPPSSSSSTRAPIGVVDKPSSCSSLEDAIKVILRLSFEDREVLRGFLGISTMVSEISSSRRPIESFPGSDSPKRGSGSTKRTHFRKARKALKDCLSVDGPVSQETLVRCQKRIRDLCVTWGLPLPDFNQDGSLVDSTLEESTEESLETELRDKTLVVESRE